VNPIAAATRNNAVRRGLSLVVASFLWAVSAAAHDFWIEPESFRLDAGSIVRIHLRVGERFEGDPVARSSDLIERFAFVTANGETNVVGRDGLDPAGIARIEKSGVIVYRSRGTPLELTREKFDQFVALEGLQWLPVERARRGEANAPWRESFSRCAKALLLTKSDAAPAFTKAVGLRLELIPQANPYALAPGKSLPVRLEFEGKPLVGALIVAINVNDPTRRVERRSDRQGRVEIPLDRSGAWLIKAVHVVRAPAGANVEWESLWASLIFDLG